MAEEGRDKYLASRAPRVRRTHPARSAQALQSSGAGIVHREMMDLQRQPELNKAETGRLKELRRDWNRNRKYTDAGMSLAGVTTPMGAQDAFMRSTEDFRQLNKPAYNQMYPLTGGFMDYADKGGIWGSLLSELAGKTKKGIKDFGDLAYSGITSALAGDTPAEKAEYVAKTFPFYPSDVHPEGEPSLVPDVFTPEVETREDKIQGLKDELQGQIDNFENPFPLLPTQEDTDDAEQDRMDDYYGKSEQGEMVFADVPEKYEDYIERGLQEPLPFDEGREAGIMNAMRAPYTRENYSLPFPPRGPHDPFDPDQDMFENREEYDAWLRRQRLGY